MDIGMFRPDQWNDFFIMVGGGAAALAGLVFVAMSINLKVITSDPRHKNRAIGTLTGFTAVFIVCALVLMGKQSYESIGVEWFLVLVPALIIYIRGYVLAINRGGSPTGLSLKRIIVGTTFYGVQILGSVFLMFG